MKSTLGTLSKAQSEKRRGGYLLISESNFAFYFLLTGPSQILVPHGRWISEPSFIKTAIAKIR